MYQQYKTPNNFQHPNNHHSTLATTHNTLARALIV